MNSKYSILLIDGTYTTISLVQNAQQNFYDFLIFKCPTHKNFNKITQLFNFLQNVFLTVKIIVFNFDFLYVQPI